MIEQKLFKWIGGKKWLSDNLNSVFGEALANKQIDTYIEPLRVGWDLFFIHSTRLNKVAFKKLS